MDAWEVRVCSGDGQRWYQICQCDGAAVKPVAVVLSLRSSAVALERAWMVCFNSSALSFEELEQAVSASDNVDPADKAMFARLRVNAKQAWKGQWLFYQLLREVVVLDAADYRQQLARLAAQKQKPAPQAEPVTTV